MQLSWSTRRSPTVRILQASGALLCNRESAKRRRAINACTFNNGSTGLIRSNPLCCVLWAFPPSAAALHRQVLPGLVKPSAVLAGRDEATGQFKTARAKEYPEGLCAALMHTLLVDWRHVAAKKSCASSRCLCSESETRSGWQRWKHCPINAMLRIFCQITNRSDRHLA